MEKGKQTLGTHRPRTERELSAFRLFKRETKGQAELKLIRQHSNAAELIKKNATSNNTTYQQNHLGK